MIRLTKPLLAQEEMAEIAKVLESGYLSRGPKVDEFECAVSAYLKVKHAIAVSSGTAALHLSVVAAGLKESDEVIVPDFTFPATANAVVLAGATPIMCDIRLDSFNIDPDEIERRITSRTRAIMPVHQFGMAADMGAISEIAVRHGLAIIEDAACSLGAKYHGKKCGTFGLLACFSFHPRKIVTTGEGGVIATDDDRLAAKLRALRHHGFENGDFALAGFNYRLSDLNAALGVAQMRRIEDLIERRRKLAAIYQASLSSIPGLTLPRETEHASHTYQSYVVLLDKRFDRDRTMVALRERNIETTIGTYAIHRTKFYSTRRDLARMPLSRSAAAYEQAVTLPLYPEMSIDEVRYVSESLDTILKSNPERFLKGR